MTAPIALFLSIVSLLALGLVGAILGLLLLQAIDAARKVLG